MQSESIPIESLSGRDSSIIGVPIEQEVVIMLVGLSSIPKKKRGAQWPKSPVQKKQSTGNSAKAQEEEV